MRPVPRRLPPLPTIADIIRLYGLSAKSQLSQNFLLDLNITDKLVRTAGQLDEASCVCEVGPGPGALTRSLLNSGAGRVVVVEKDRRFLPSLELLREASGDRVDVYYGDALTADVAAICGEYVEKKEWEDDPPNFHLVGNLPFNVSIPLLLQWLGQIPYRKGPFSFGRTQMTLTFQKEVAERITAPPGHPQRSRLSVMTQHLCHTHWGFTLPGSVFVPAPKVDAAVLHLTPLTQSRVCVEYSTLELVVRCLFQYRRKIIKRGASLLFPDRPDLTEQLFSVSSVPSSLRAQQLTLEQFEQLCLAYQHLSSSSLEHPSTSSQEHLSSSSSQEHLSDSSSDSSSTL